MSRKRICFYLFLICLASMLLRIPSLLVTFVNIDENEIALAAKIISEGGIPYKDYLIYQPPFLYYLYAWVIQFIPAPSLSDSMWWVHFFTLFYVALTCVGIYFLGRAASQNARDALFSALFFAVFSTTYLPQDMLATNHELVMLLPMVLCAFFFMKEKYFFSGLFLGLTLLTKYQGGILLPAMALFLMLQKRIRSFFPILLQLAGASLVGALWVYYLYKKGAFLDAKNCFLYILAYAKGPPQSDWLYITLKFLLRTLLIAASSFGLWYFALKGFRSRIRSTDFFFILWVLSGFFAVISGSRIYFHYYLILYPPLALLAGRQAGHFFDRLQQIPLEKVLWKLTLFILMLSLPVTGFTAYATYKPFRPKSKKDDWVYVVDYIQDRTKPNDPIFVWGYCPQIYTISDRPMATRFTTSDYLTGRTPKTAGLEFNPKTFPHPSAFQKVMRDFKTPVGIVEEDTSENIYPGAWELLMKDFAKKTPVLFIDTSPSNYRMYGRYPIEKYPLLKQFVEKNYVFEASIRGMDIYRLRKLSRKE